MHNFFYALLFSCVISFGTHVYARGMADKIVLSKDNAQRYGFDIRRQQWLKHKDEIEVGVIFPVSYNEKEFKKVSVSSDDFYFPQIYGKIYKTNKRLVIFTLSNRLLAATKIQVYYGDSKQADGSGYIFIINLKEQAELPSNYAPYTE